MATVSKPPNILLLGGHGKVSLLLTPLLLARAWNVTSVIRNPEHKADIEKAAALANTEGKGQKGSLNVLVESLEDVKSEADAKEVIEKAGGVDWVVWSAGAGGKGGPSRTFAIDRDACKHYIKASISTPSIQKFLLVSYTNSRRTKAPWWTDEDYAAAHSVNLGVLKNYFAAKVESDEYLTALAHRRRSEEPGSKFQDIILRPGALTDQPASGKVTLGRTKARGQIPRADVAAVAVALLEKAGSRGWIDLLEGNVPIAEAVNQVVTQGIDSIEGEDIERIYALK